LQCKAFWEYCNFPSVLIGITANRLEIAIAVCVGSIYVTKLLMLDLSLDFHASDNIICLARVFKVLRHHQLDLKEYYRSIKTLLAAPPTLSCLFPSPTLIDPSIPMPKLTYREFLARDGRPMPEILDLGSTTTAMYTAILDDTKEKVIVKFTARYNEKVHRLLAEAQLAPKLHFCERVIGDLYMVVMEYVEGKSVWQLRREKTPIPKVVATKVEKAVNLLHEHDIVFGDLRCNNVLVVGSGADARAVLVDFDWAGEQGKGRYPATLNPDIVGDTWHVGVLPYHIMHKDHDLWLLKELKELCV
jgi:serine/threonine protein kinase